MLVVPHLSRFVHCSIPTRGFTSFLVVFLALRHVKHLDFPVWKAWPGLVVIRWQAQVH